MTTTYDHERSYLAAKPASLAVGLTAPANQIGESVTGAFATAFGYASNVTREIARRHRRNKSIRTLDGLSNHILRDIGVSRSDIYRVADEVSHQAN
ncbi:MAG: DUF1127 domain-containing protein [Gammaproteobacteria bacterium]|nr:DUF1127 domain-containing protein [Gammaproteobacteria bacterium]